MDSPFLYLKDLTGNIIGIYNEYGKEVARYIYDAYGNHEVLDEYGIINNNATFIGNINPFRYKGYYYDVETGLYYCNSRYYNSKIYRWISSDDIDYLEPESINGLNLYVYCGNEPPINYADPSGNAPKWLQIAGWIGLGIGIILCSAAIIILAKEIGTATLIGSIAVGAANGTLIGTGTGIAISAVEKLALTWTATIVGILSSVTVIAAQTKKSGGYYGERWP